LGSLGNQNPPFVAQPSKSPFLESVATFLGGEDMSSVRFVCLLLILGSAVLAAQSNMVAIINQPATSNVSSGLSTPDPKTQGEILENYGKLPLSFEANRGETDARVKFVSRGSGYTLFLTGDEAVFSLRGSKAKGEALPASPQLQPAVLPTANTVLRMKLVKANPSAKVTGAEELPGKSNYFIGRDPKKWRSNITNYAKVKYEGIYSGIDLVYYGNGAVSRVCSDRCKRDSRQSANCYSRIAATPRRRFDCHPFRWPSRPVYSLYRLRIAAPDRPDAVSIRSGLPGKCRLVEPAHIPVLVNH
jgi:hypothetical protein